LLHLVDGTSDDVAKDYQTIIGELEAYGGDLADKPRITVLNKIDALGPELTEMQLAELQSVAGDDVMVMSGVSGDGVTEVLRAMRSIIEGPREEEVTGDGPWRP
jgi:GTP-binding protein